jgi:hypothetical protein
MTPDHRPYLREGDLRTAEDVLEWLRQQVDPGWSYLAGRGEFEYALKTRLDRERRQACRRGARENFAKFSAFARWCKGHRVVPVDEYEAMTLNWISAALSFRAAARGK